MLISPPPESSSKRVTDADRTSDYKSNGPSRLENGIGILFIFIVWLLCAVVILVFSWFIWVYILIRTIIESTLSLLVHMICTERPPSSSNYIDKALIWLPQTHLRTVDILSDLIYEEKSISFDSENIENKTTASQIIMILKWIFFTLTPAAAMWVGFLFVFDLFVFHISLIQFNQYSYLLVFIFLIIIIIISIIIRFFFDLIRIFILVPLLFTLSVIWIPVGLLFAIPIMAQDILKTSFSIFGSIISSDENGELQKQVHFISYFFFGISIINEQIASCFSEAPGGNNLRQIDQPKNGNRTKNKNKNLLISFIIKIISLAFYPLLIIIIYLKNFIFKFLG